jgi:hypothetical protein
VGCESGSGRDQARVTCTGVDSGRGAGREEDRACVGLERRGEIEEDDSMDEESSSIAVAANSSSIRARARACCCASSSRRMKV